MKRFTLAMLMLVLMNAASFAQAVLPTSWDFSTATLPTGWTSTGTFGYYTGSGSPPPAAKFQSTADKLTIQFTTTPGNLSYDIVGNSFSGGTFLVEESTNGTTWTTLHTFTAPSSTYTTFTDVPASASRYIRFNYSNKVSGNVGLDNVSIAAGVSTTQQINIKLAAATIVNGGTASFSSPVATMTPVSFTVENLGTVGTLNISGVTITGAAAADYSVASFPSTVAPTSNATMVINFTPSVSGSRLATLTIANDDPTANPYIINLYGIGGSYASTPAAQPTGLSFTLVKSYHFRGSFTAASGCDGYVVLRRTGSPVTDVPANGTIYQRGDVIGSSKVVFSSNATAFFPNEIVANTTYYFAIFAFNGPGTYRSYLTTSPLTGNVTTSGSMQPAAYYSSVSTASPTFVADLHAKINPHTIQFYSNYGPLMVSKFYARDTTADQRVVTCVYSGLNQVYTEPFDWTSNDFSREHTYCHSWMPTYLDPSTTSLPEYNDYHMLTPTNQTNVNAVRSNYPLGEVVGAPISTFLGSKIGYNAAGKKVFEPRDSDKGDAARCMMYEAVCYTTVSGNSWAFPNPISASIPYGQDQNVLKKWHYQDPPDAFEIARNDYVDSLQGNRNPFIDSVQFACYIDFSTMTYVNSPLVPCNTSTIGINESADNDMIMIAPNPNDGNFMLTYISPKAQNISVQMFDAMGRLVFSSESKVAAGYNPMNVTTEALSKGIYSLVFRSETGRRTEKIVIR